MADVTVSQFAEALKVPVDKLLTQLDQAGIAVNGADDALRVITRINADGLARLLATNDACVLLKGGDSKFFDDHVDG